MLSALQSELEYNFRNLSERAGLNLFGSGTPWNVLITYSLAGSGKQREIGPLCCLTAFCGFCRESVRSKLPLELKEQVLAIKELNIYSTLPGKNMFGQPYCLLNKIKVILYRIQATDVKGKIELEN